MTTEIKQFAKAFIAAQKEMGNASKDSKNPFFKSKYADLNSIREACLPALNQHGIAVLQPIVQVDGVNFVKTLLLHESGESMESLTAILFNKANDAQAQGSGITYARRYGLQSLVNIGAEDDDGQKASAGKSNAKPNNNSGLSNDLAEGSNDDLSKAYEDSRLIKLKAALADMGSISEVDGYLETIYKGKTRLETLAAMREENAAEATKIIKDAKVRIDND